MKCKLKELIQLIEDHFDKEVWYSKSPLKEIDYQLALLSLKMGNIKKNIRNGTITDIEYATYNEKGEMTYTCPTCGELLTKSLPKLKTSTTKITKSFVSLILFKIGIKSKLVLSTNL